MYIGTSKTVPVLHQKHRLTCMWLTILADPSPFPPWQPAHTCGTRRSAKAHADRSSRQLSDPSSFLAGIGTYIQVSCTWARRSCRRDFISSHHISVLLQS